MPVTLRYCSLDAWRGLACLAVVVFHSFGAFFQQSVWSTLEPVKHVAEHGWLGLHLFFVISGYCIYERLRGAHREKETASAFLRDRMLRVFPTYWIALVVLFLLGLAASPFNGTTVRGNLPRSWLDTVGDLSLTHIYFGNTPYLLVSWTLACEVMFYVAAAVFYSGTRRQATADLWLVPGALLCLVPLWLRAAPWATPIFLWPDFFVGCAAGTIWHALRDRRLAVAVVGMVVLAAMTLASAMGTAGYDSLSRGVACCFAWILLILRVWDRSLNKLAPVEALGWIGTFSYSLYLVHAPLVSRAMNLGTRYFQATSAGFCVVWLLGLAVAGTGGWLFWLTIERPTESFRRRSRTNLRTSPGALSPTSQSSD